ncbi:hypothetical protein Tco_1222633, partial [Tanacetum coccineum]
LKMKSDLQAQVADPELWDVLKAKFEKSSASAGSCRDDAFRKRDHDDHQGDDAPPKGEKSAKRQKTSKSLKSARGSSSKQPVKDTNTSASEQQQQQQDWDAWVDDPVIDEDEVIPEDETPELINEFQNVDKRVPTIFDRERIEATLRDMLSNQFRDVVLTSVPLFIVLKLCSACFRVFTRNTYGDHVVLYAGIIGIKHRHNVVRDTFVDICFRSGIPAGKEVDIGLSDGRDKPLHLVDMLCYSWDEGLDLCIDLTGSSPLMHTRMVD